MIKVQNITKKYGNFVAVDDISFEIKKGEIVGLLGENGAGKTTTMNMITGFIEQTNGKILIDDIDTLKRPKKAKRKIGYMPEGVPLYTDLTVKEFVTFMAEIKKVKRKERKEKVEKTLKETGLFDVQNKLIKNLSRGYKQRVSLAGTLASDPEILILDEPTNGLDPAGIHEIRNLVKSLPKRYDCTVLISSHMLSEIELLADDIGILNHGRLLFEGSLEDLKFTAHEAGFENDNLEEMFLSMIDEDNTNRKQRLKL